MRYTVAILLFGLLGVISFVAEVATTRQVVHPPHNQSNQLLNVSYI